MVIVKINRIFNQVFPLPHRLYRKKDACFTRKRWDYFEREDAGIIGAFIIQLAQGINNR
jgi:hypothetical protein